MRVPSLDSVAADVVRSGAARAAVVASAFRLENAWKVQLGAAGVSPEGPIDAGAVFDLASVSKSFVAAALARACQTGRSSLALPLGQALAELRDTPSGPLALDLFLSHRAGLEAHRPLFAPLVRGETFDRALALRVAAEARRPDAEGLPPAEGFAPLYSDLGYVLIGAALERAYERPLDAIVRELVADPLSLDVGSAAQWLRASPDFPRRVLPTECVPWRGGELRGVVHDENAWALAGHGLAGQAGLFGTAEAVARFGAALLDSLGGRRVDWLEPTALSPLVRERPGGTLRAGFDGKSAQVSAAGSVSSSSTFGHLGFTGTSFWCDPVAESVTVLLTNRVCPTRENQKIRAARPKAHDALFDYAKKLGLVSHEHS